MAGLVVVAYPQLISAFLPNRFTALGTDGFGRSDTSGALRRFFEVDRDSSLVSLDMREEVASAMQRYGIEGNTIAPLRICNSDRGQSPVRIPGRASHVGGLIRSEKGDHVADLA